MFAKNNPSPPRSSSSQRPFSPPMYELNNMPQNDDTVITITDPQYVQDYPFDDKKADVTISATEVPDPRKQKRPGMGRRATTNHFGTQNEAEHQLTGAGQAWFRLIENPFMRYCIYVLPVAAALAIPLILYATTEPYKSKKKDKIRLLGLFIWLEIVWVSFWIAKIFAKLIPFLFQIVCGIFSTGVRKYALVLRACEIPMSLFIWSVMIYCWYPIIYVCSQKEYHQAHVIPHGKKTFPGIHWLSIIHKVLKATIGVTALYLGEKLLIQLISVSYHKRQYHDKIREIKKTSAAVDLLYDASIRRFPTHHKDFMEEDYNIHDTSGVQRLGRELSADKSTMKFLGDMGWFSEKITTALGTLASDVTGKQIKPTASHAIVEQALEHKYAAEALAIRIFKSLVSPGKDAITEQDIFDELGNGHEAEASFIFAQLDKDGNGDVSLEEMIMLIGDISRQRKATWRTAVDVKEAIKILDRLLEFIVLLLILLIYAAFFSNYLATHYSQIWSTFTGLGFMLGTTSAEFLGSCILVFVKHPYDVGDRVVINSTDLEVIRISLMYTVFRRIDSDSLVQYSNSIIAATWLENVSRSAAMKERLTFSVSAGTSFEDIECLRRELEAFVQLDDNRRDFFPEVDIELLSVGDLKQLDLRVEIRHKNNWSDERLRAFRRSKFMCALLSAMRKVPIDGPGSGGPAPGSTAAPNYSVTISDSDAKEFKAQFDADKDAKRLFPRNAAAVGTAISSGLDMLPSLINRKMNADVVNAGVPVAQPNLNPFQNQYQLPEGVQYRNLNYPPRPGSRI